MADNNVGAGSLGPRRVLGYPPLYVPIRNRIIGLIEEGHPVSSGGTRIVAEVVYSIGNGGDIGGAPPVVGGVNSGGRIGVVVRLQVVVGVVVDVIVVDRRLGTIALTPNVYAHVAVAGYQVVYDGGRRVIPYLNPCAVVLDGVVADIG